MVTFLRHFLLKGVDRTLPLGAYEVLTDEELIEGLSFPVYRRISTMILVPRSAGAASVEMVTVDPRDFQAAQDGDSATLQLAEADGAKSAAESKPAWDS
jgi:hypothetical protein